jgi:hypothetical protein
MNANELADYLDEFYKKYVPNDAFEESANMLRQQALEIQALHQILGYEGVAVGQDYLDECVAEIRKAQEK